jgi:hypothetical protein
MEEMRVALRTPEACVPVRLDALTPPVHSCIPRVGLCTPPLIGPGQGTPPQSHPPYARPTAPPVYGGGWPTSSGGWAPLAAHGRVPDRALGARAGSDTYG